MCQEDKGQVEDYVAGLHKCVNKDLTDPRSLLPKSHHRSLWYTHNTLFWVLGVFRNSLQEVKAVPTRVNTITM